MSSIVAFTSPTLLMHRIAVGADQLHVSFGRTQHARESWGPRCQPVSNVVPGAGQIHPALPAAHHFIGNDDGRP
ncbi:MAG: hypothetical protein MI923_05635 [Phycisphaerales bacterium]|nr:hypothetical protein [Phycisphaerales bacterium]